MSIIYHYYAALYGVRKTTAYSAQVRAIVGKMSAVAKLQTPLLAQTTTDLNALDAAQQLAHKGSPAQTADRNAKLKVVQSDARQLKAFVQSVADADLLNAQSIIESSGMSVAKKPLRTKPDLAATVGKVPTTATLSAKALKSKVAYQWQMSVDQKTWTDLPGTVKATTSVANLTPGTIYYFRFRTLTVAGLSDWSTVASLIAH